MNKYKKFAKQAQKANKKLRDCESKKAFDSEEEAFQKNQRTYKCPHCNKWHRSGSLTSLINKVNKGKK